MMSARRLLTESEAAASLLTQAITSGHYVKTPADEECPTGLWLLVPLDRHHVRILDMAGAERADLEDDEREPDVDGEPTVVSPHMMVTPDGPAEWMSLSEWQGL